MKLLPPHQRCPRPSSKVVKAIRRFLLSIDPRCYYCRREMHLGMSTLEHITPLSLGGTNDPENLAIACVKCNRQANYRTLASVEVPRPMSYLFASDPAASFTKYEPQVEWVFDPTTPYIDEEAS
jgi:hypothetical protein